jgi:hypothetical protein
MAIDVETAIASKLTTALSATIGSRMHPLRFPDTPTFPCITYQEISAPVVGSHDETSPGRQAIRQDTEMPFPWVKLSSMRWKASRA